MSKIFILLIIGFCIGFISCNTDKKPKDTNQQIEQELINEDRKNKPGTGIAEPDINLLETSERIINLIKEKKFVELGESIHPEKGVRFSPYAYINTESDLRFLAAQFQENTRNEEPLTWGIFDGSGEVISMNFSNYYKKFIYDVDFANPEKISENASLAQGNSINNISEMYPGCEYVEYYFSGFDEQFGGMDWKALRLVFEKKVNRYYIVGVIHDQWTS